ncbi:MAG: hypothetical protein BWX80_01607 [Candidatus Hydrogenedentes bacterium ADurb.Bin101]|nr:MAG: hypothetical protein BWX80_01607 [Candidatus Hydrogenedentes bacterium ADurb.Bin101]
MLKDLFSYGLTCQGRPAPPVVNARHFFVHPQVLVPVAQVLVQQIVRPVQIPSGFGLVADVQGNALAEAIKHKPSRFLIVQQGHRENGHEEGD